jgi:hypothetical protein
MSKKPDPLEDELNAIRIQLYEQTKDMTTQEQTAFLTTEDGRYWHDMVLRQKSRKCRFWRRGTSYPPSIPFMKGWAYENKTYPDARISDDDLAGFLREKRTGGIRVQLYAGQKSIFLLYLRF